MFDDEEDLGVPAESLSHVIPTALQDGLPEVIKNGFHALSAHHAERVMIECAYPHQRRLEPQHAKALAEVMRIGQWLDYDKVDFARLGGKLILVNGYHRMYAQMLAGITIKWTIVIHECLNAEQVRALYVKFDVNQRIRTTEQILNGIQFSEKFGIPKTVGKAVFDAMPYIYNRFITTKMGRDLSKMKVMDHRLAMARGYLEEAKLLARCLAGGNGKITQKIRNGGVAAVALVTLKHQPDKALEFWRGVARNDGLRSGDPRHRLCEDLLTRKMNSGLSHAACASPAIAWNAFFAGRSLKIIRVYDAESVKIDGTPFSDEGK